MHYNVLFRVENIDKINLTLIKIKNLKAYLQSKGDAASLEVAVIGNAVQHFSELPNEFVQEDLDVTLCHNALQTNEMDDINFKNIRTVPAGVGEVIERKAEGFIEYFVG